MTRLGMLKICPDGSLPAEAKIVQDLTTKQIPERISTVFEGVGEIKHHQAVLCMTEDAKPIAQWPRNVAYHLCGPLKKLLDQGVREDIYEKVPEGKLITWCSPLVVQPKPKYAAVKGGELKPHMIRACIDLRVPNKFMQKSRITREPTIEDFTYTFNNCTVFSKMDMN